MCGIVGYSGHVQAAPILLEGLSRLEYRGYDSAGLAVVGDSGDIDIVKASGRLKALYEKTDDGASMHGVCGIGHTRWATHGEPTETNAHPHCSDDRAVVAVHNGIIENYQELRDKLTRSGYSFYSDTDTEVAVKLIDFYYKKYQLGPVDAMSRFMLRVRGSYALAVLFHDYPGEIYVARKDNPLVIAVREGESFISSDVAPLLKYSREIYFLNSGELGRLTAGTATFYNVDQQEIEKKPVHIDWDADAAEKKQI